MILIDKCYSEITPESAEDGDTSDAGFEWINCPVSFRELVDYMREHSNPSNMPASGGTFEWYSTGYSIDDYATGTERETTIHFSRENPPHKAKYWKLASKFAGLTK